MIGIVLCLIIVFSLFTVGCKERQGLKFVISYPSEVSDGPITGRVYVMISEDDRREPRLQVRTHGVPFYGKDVEGLEAEEPVFIDEDVFGYPVESIKSIPPGEYYVQGFVNIYTEFKRADGHTVWMHNDQWEGQRWNISPGNIYSDVLKDYDFGLGHHHCRDAVSQPSTRPGDGELADVLGRFSFGGHLTGEYGADVGRCDADDRTSCVVHRGCGCRRALSL